MSHVMIGNKMWLPSVKTVTKKSSFILFPSDYPVNWRGENMLFVSFCVHHLKQFVLCLFLHILMSLYSLEMYPKKKEQASFSLLVDFLQFFEKVNTNAHEEEYLMSFKLICGYHTINVWTRVIVMLRSCS